MKAKEVMNKYGICRETLCRWVKNGRIKYIKTPSGRYDYIDKIESDIKVEKKTVIYARCSTSGQKDNLDRQIDRLKFFASAKGYIINHVYSEIASALNYNRKEYRKLYKEIISNNIETIIIEYKDRLLRIGFDDFQELCNLFNVNLIVLDESNDKSKHQEIVEDMVAIIHHFSSKIYSTRKRKKIIDELISNEEIVTE
jgi:predicted site-specific integrase-resolvase